MTTAAICAIREVSWRPSFYRGEQYDSDLALYYLRARYYNPNTGRFLSRDPENGISTDPKTLHKYDYAGGDPVNAMDPTGRSSMVEYLLPIVTIDLGPNKTQRMYDKYTQQYVTTSAPQTILALKNLACAVKALYVQGSFTVLGILSDADSVGCTAWPEKCSVTARCVPIQAYNLGKYGAQHCEASVTTSSGNSYEVSAGPAKPPYNGKLGGWATPVDSFPSDGMVVYMSNSCKIADCMVSVGKNYQSHPSDWPNYNPILGPNSNTWIQVVGGVCGAYIPINTWGGLL